MVFTRQAGKAECVANAPFSDDSDPHSWALAHPSRV